MLLPPSISTHDPSGFSKRFAMPAYNSLRRLTLAILLLMACGPVCAGQVDDVTHRAAILEEAGDFGEATAVLAEGFAANPDPAILNAWLVMNDRWLKTLASKQNNKGVRTNFAVAVDGSTLKTVDSSFFKLEGAQFREAGRKMLPEGGEIIITPDLTDQTCFQRFPAYGAHDANLLLKILHKMRDDALQDTASDEDIQQRLLGFSQCGKSILRSTASISHALRSGSPDALPTLLKAKKQADDSMKRLRASRAAFVSYDYIGPNIIAARLFLMPDTSGFSGWSVGDKGLSHAAERLGEGTKELAHSSKEVRRLWVETLSEIRRIAGAERFKHLEATATLVAGDSLGGPDQWRPE